MSINRTLSFANQDCYIDEVSLSPQFFHKRKGAIWHVALTENNAVCAITQLNI